MSTKEEVKIQVIECIKKNSFYRNNNDIQKQICDNILENYSTDIFCPKIINNYECIANSEISDIQKFICKLKNIIIDNVVSLEIEDSSIVAISKRREHIFEIAKRINKKLIKDFILECRK